MKFPCPLLCAGLLLGWLPLRGLAAEPPPAYRFKVETLAAGMPRPMELEVAPDGRIFFNELAGDLRFVRPGTGVVDAGRIPVWAEQEGGFLGFALDPDFARNQHLFLFYSPTNYVGNRLSRFTMDGDRLDLASEKVLLEFPVQREECCHHAGSVEFGPDGTLFISTGDNTHPGGDSDGYAPIDERPGREPYDAQDGPANTHDLRGKILRIRPTPEGGYTIPEGNLFPHDGSAGRPEIYVMGCRNPWRISVDPQNGFLYWGEVGPDAGGDGPRGPRGYDELNQARRAGNFGWPYLIADNQPYARYDFATRQVGEKYDPAGPENRSRNNTGARVLPPGQAAFIYWPYGKSTRFPELGEGGRTACAGPVFHFRPEFEQTGGFPAFYDRSLIFFDWQRPFLKWARLTPSGDLAGIEAFPSVITLANDRSRIAEAEARGEFVVRRPVDAQFGPDGCLYLLDYGETWGVNPDARLLRISYQWGNLAPTAVATVTPGAGREPLRVQLSARGSRDPEGGELTFEWRRHPANTVIATNAEATVELTEPGSHILELIVKDTQGGIDRVSQPVVVGNAPPELRFLEPADGDFFLPGQPVTYRLHVRDAEDGDSRADDELLQARAFVEARWSKGGSSESQDPPGLALMKQSDCFNCHAVETRIVGPPLREIARKYADQDGALETSVQRVRLGSSRVWGEVPMLPHASLNEDQIRLMVRWIYGLRDGQPGSGLVRGLEGTVAPPAGEGWQLLTLQGSYTDAGRGVAAPLAVQRTLRLRNPQLEAESASTIHGARVLGHFIGSIDDGHALEWSPVQLRGVDRVTVRVASGGVGGQLEVRAGDREGQILASFSVKPTGGWEQWIEQTSAVAPSTASTLVVVFRNPGKGGLMNLDWIRLERTRASVVPTSSTTSSSAGNP